MDTQAFVAVSKFGLGRRGEEPLPPNPRAWLESQLHGPYPTQIAPPPTLVAGLLALRADRKDKPQPGSSQGRALYRDAATSQLANALTTQTPFHERLVWFWTNHFTVSLRRGECAGLIGAFIEEAIRPHVTGPFLILLTAVMRHPAMLLYLDNVSSVGPDSPAAQRSRRGLNENLARECLELHTVTPAANYTQTDVTSFAKILTGWSMDLAADPPGFRFRPNAHEPGEQIVLGRSFPNGEAGGTAALAFLAGHPATHHALAAKLARHFISDTPSAASVRQIETALHDTDGNLGAAALALVHGDAAWEPGTKLRSPQDFAIAAMRALDLPEANRPNLPAILAGLGQPFCNAPAPNGWPDQAADWAAPEAMLRRIDWAHALAGRDGQMDPQLIAAVNLGPLLRASTAEQIQRAGSRRDGLTLFLTSPEFQRR